MRQYRPRRYKSETAFGQSAWRLMASNVECARSDAAREAAYWRPEATPRGNIRLHGKFLETNSWRGMTYFGGDQTVCNCATIGKSRHLTYGNALGCDQSPSLGTLLGLQDSEIYWDVSVEPLWRFGHGVFKPC